MILKYAFVIPLLNLIPFVFGWKNLMYKKDKKGKLFSSYLITSAICGLTCILLWAFGKNNQWCYNCLQIILFIIISYIFRIELKKNLISLFAYFTTFLLIFNTFYQGFYNFNQINFNIIFTLVGIMSASFLKDFMLNAIEPQINEFEFWMYSGFFVFSFGSLFFNLFFHKIQTNDFLLKFYTIYQFFLNVITNFFFTKATLLLKHHED